MIELILKLEEPAKAGGGAGEHACTVERKLRLDRTVLTPADLLSLKMTFMNLVNLQLEELVDDIFKAFEQKVQATSRKKAKADD